MVKIPYEGPRFSGGCNNCSYKEKRIAELEAERAKDREFLKRYCVDLEARYDNSDSDGALYLCWQEVAKRLEE